MKVNSVLGPLSRNELGVVSPHEHIFINLSAFFSLRPLDGIAHPESEPVKMEYLGQLNRDPYALKDNLIMNNYTTQLREVSRFRTAGGSTLVDATMPGIGRDANQLAKIAKASGLNIIMGTGYYVASTHPDSLSHMTEAEIAEEMLREINEGVDGIKAGIIGEIGISEVFNEAERRVLRAAAIAQKKSGAGILLHINPWTVNGLEAVSILLEQGAVPDRIAVSHIDVENRENYVLALLEQGVFVEFDNFGKEYYVETNARREGYGCFVTDLQRISFLKRLIQKGYLNQILLSCDVCLKTLLRTYGGWGYDHLLRNVLPMMCEAGISQKEIDTMLKENPANFLCGRNENDTK